MANSPLEQRHLATDERKKIFAQEELILEVAESIWEEMERRELNKKQLAETLNCSPAYVTQILNGGRNMTLRTLADIATALELQVKFSLTENQNGNNWEKGFNLFLGDVTRHVNTQFVEPQNDYGVLFSTVKTA